MTRRLRPSTAVLLLATGALVLGGLVVLVSNDDAPRPDSDDEAAGPSPATDGDSRAPAAPAPADPSADGPRPEVLEGLDGWLFFARDVDPDCRGLASFRPPDDVTGDPAVLRYMVNEPKSAFHPEQLAPEQRPAACVDATRRSLRASRATDASAIDVDLALRAARDAGTTVFFEAGSHWSPAGRIVAAEALIEALEPGRWDPNSVVDADLPELHDLRTLLRGPEDPAVVRGPTVARGQVTVVEQQTATLAGETFITFQRSRSGPDGTIDGVTYVVGDSQLAHLLPEIESYFEELVFINWFLVEHGDPPTVPELDPDRLIVQSVERAVIDRFDHPFLGELAARLPQ